MSDETQAAPKRRSQFTGRLGFILSGAASAIGLGNLWRFPYLTAQYGGGTFLVTYLILAFTVGISLLLTEVALGRMTQKSAMGAFSSFGKKYKWIGILVSIIPMIIMPYYAVIGGWTVKYFFSYLTGSAHLMADGGDYFMTFMTGTSAPLIFFAIFSLMVVGVIALGVTRGIERSNRILMPALLIMLVGMSIFVCTLPGAIDGLKFLFIPDWSKFSTDLLLAALGQMFYSLSLAMGIMITYGSYYSKKENLAVDCANVAFLDSLVAILAGVLIIPAFFFASGGAPESAGVGLMFISLPTVFDAMPGSSIFGTVFFLLVIFAALTSCISLAEAVTAQFIDWFDISRKKALLLTGVDFVIIGIPSALGFGALAGVTPFGMDFLDFFDFISNSILMPIVAIIICLFVARVVTMKKMNEEISHGDENFKMQGVYNVMVKFVAPIAVLAVLVSSILKFLGIITF